MEELLLLIMLISIILNLLLKLILLLLLMMVMKVILMELIVQLIVLGGEVVTTEVVRLNDLHLLHALLKLLLLQLVCKWGEKLCIVRQCLVLRIVLIRNGHKIFRAFLWIKYNEKN